jgi:photosystem II stability/assembly factor-like uncharacterized protein
MFLTTLAVTVAVLAAPEETWKQPLAEKERIINENILKRHNILGLYPSMVQVPLDSGPQDISPATPFSDIAHAVCWTSNHLAGASYRYAALKKEGAPPELLETARKRADELFEAVYRCQLVTGVKGLQARGYFIGYGEAYEERAGSGKSDDWHQGAGEYRNFRWRGDPSHHNYSDSIFGLGTYYDLAAEGEQQQRSRTAINNLVSYWVDNDLQIQDIRPEKRPVPILGFTDGKTLNTRIMMAIAGAKVAHHATGDEKFKKVYDQLIDQYGVRGTKTFQTGKDFDDAEHVLCHLETLFRIEDDPELLAAYRAVLDGLWANHKEDGQSLFTYIYLSLTPEALERDQALTQAHQALYTWPTDTTVRPAMAKLSHPGLEPPYPVYAAAWDNEYIWKGHLLGSDGWLSRIVTDLAVPAEEPNIIYAIDQAGDLYQSRDGAATAVNWIAVDAALPVPARAVAAADKTRKLAVACDDGFYASTTAGHSWSKLPVPADGGRAVDVAIDRANANIIYAITDRGVYRSLDFGDKFLGKTWETLTDGLPQAGSSKFTVALNPPGRIYAVLDGEPFTRSLDNPAWTRGATTGLGEYSKNYTWLAVDPNNADRAITGFLTEYAPGGGRSVLQETNDGGLTWTNTMESIYTRYSDGTLMQLLASAPAGEMLDLVISPHDPMLLLAAAGEKGVLKSTDGGKTWHSRNEGLAIPLAQTVFAPQNSEWVFTGTPAGLYVSKDQGDTWAPANLVLQFTRNTRRELGGAAYIDAFWRARYYGFLDQAAANAPWQEP